MEINIEKLLEDINGILGEEQLEDEIQPEVAPEVTEPEFNDTMSLADEFDAKARIARALEALQAAVDEFKDATAEKVDLIADAKLLQEIEGLDVAVKNVEEALRGGSNLLGTELNDPFNTELPGEEAVVEEPKEEEEELTPEEEEAELADLDARFDELASMDLLAGGEE